MRRFAVDDLQLPDNASYRRYADLHRPSAVWSVVAAPPTRWWRRPGAIR
jgi:predicted aminopeptidase